MAVPSKASLAIFAPPRLSVDGTPVVLPSPYAFAVLGRLALLRGGRIDRRQLADDLWPELDRARSYAELRRQLHYIDRAWARAGNAGRLVLRERRELRVADVGLQVDALTFERLCTRSDDLEDALALYGGDLLPGFDDPVLSREREHFRLLAQDALERLVERLKTEGRLRDAIVHARRLHALDPYREQSVRTLMLLQAADGERAGALRTYRDFAALVERELQTRPLPATIALAERLGHDPPDREGGLPREHDRFVGRDRERRGIAGAFAAEGTRTVTIIGSPGIGKTRLALRVANELYDTFPDGVRFIDLRGVRDAAAVERLVRDAFGGASSGSSRVEEVVGNRRILLVLDNCEHLAAAIAPLVRSLLQRCERVAVLATSRRPLRIAGHREVRLGPLDTPAAEGPDDRIASSPAVQLFVDRARSVRWNELDLAPMRSVATICRALGGIPLALELAASRLRSTSLRDLEREVTSGRSRRLADRVDAAIEAPLSAAYRASYDALTATAQRAFRYAAVFESPFTLRALHGICGGEAGITTGVRELVENSLFDPPALDDVEGRFTILSPAAEFARAMLDERGELDDALARHSAYVLDDIGARGQRAVGPLRHELYPALRRDLPELRAALTFAIDRRGDVERGLAVCVALLRFWNDAGFVGEGRTRIESGLAAGTLEPALRAAALHAASVLARRQSDAPAAVRYGDAARAEFAALGDRSGESRAHIALANAHTVLGELDEGAAAGRRALELAGAGSVDEAFATLAIAQTALSRGDFEGARVDFSRGARLANACGLAAEAVVAINNVAMCALLAGDDDEAERCAAESLRRSRELTLALHAAWALFVCASVAWRRDRLGTALGLSDEVVAAARAVEARVLEIRTLEDVAGYLERHGDAAGSASLLGSAGTARDRYAVPALPVEQTAHDRLIGSLVAALGRSGYEAAYSVGGTFDLDAAFNRARTFALRVPSGHGKPGGTVNAATRPSRNVTVYESPGPSS